MCESCEERFIGKLPGRGFCDSEIDYLWYGYFIVLSNKDIRRLNVAMNDSLLMRVLDSLANLDE